MGLGLAMLAAAAGVLIWQMRLQARAERTTAVLFRETMSSQSNTSVCRLRVKTRDGEREMIARQVNSRFAHQHLGEEVDCWYFPEETGNLASKCYVEDGPFGGVGPKRALPLVLIFGIIGIVFLVSGFKITA